MAESPPVWRRILAWVCLILFCLAAPLVLVTGWARLTLLDSDVYARTVSAVAADSRVQEGVTQAVTAKVEMSLAGENPTAGEAVQARVAAELAGQATSRVVASERFLETWEAANRAVHDVLAAGLAAGSGQPVVLDLSPLQEEIAAAIEAQGAAVPPGLEIETADLRIEVLDAATADRIRRAVGLLDAVFWAMLAMMVLTLILSIALVPDRLAALGRAAFGLSLAMIALIALMLVAQEGLASAAATAGARLIVVALLEAVSQGLRVVAIGLALAGLLLAGIFFGLRALRGSTAPRAVG